MPDHLKLSKVSNYGDPGFSSEAGTSLVAFLQWGFLEIGAFQNVQINQQAAYSGDVSRLHPVTDTRRPSGVVWGGLRREWVYESGLDFATQPIPISGIFVDGVFRPNGSGYSIDYPNGQVVFASPPTSSGGGVPTVKVAHSYRHVSFITSAHPGWKEIQYRSFRADDPDFLAGSGAWGILAENRVQLPAVVVDVLPQVGNLYGYELGEKTRWHNQAARLYVLAENKWDRDQIHDILVNQWEKVFYLLDTYRMRVDNKFPLVNDRYRNPSGLLYPDLAKPAAESGYAYTSVSVGTVASEPTADGPSLYAAEVRWMLKTVI